MTEMDRNCEHYFSTALGSRGLKERFVKVSGIAGY